MLLITIVAVAILGACGEPDDEVEPTVTRIPVEGAPGASPTAEGAPPAPSPEVPADGSPVASPATSPVASPVASPGVSPEAPAETPAAPDEGDGGVVGDVERGRQLAAQCLGCHSTDGSQLVGPTWLGLYGSERELESGETVIADEAYIRQSIVDPTSQIVKGYPPAMPPFATLTDQQIADLIEYIKSLSQ